MELHIEPQKEHQWLQKLAGEWTFELEATMAPGQPPVKSTGTETVRPLGGFWILAEAQGEMSCGGPATTIMTLGYDPRKNRFVGTFIGSMISNLWVYDGQLDAAERALALDAEGPHLAAQDKVAKYKDIIEIKSDAHRILRSEMLDDDGKWREIMTIHYRRK
ncbi:MAG: DUF1579 domain-containing protein [Bryobacteraceae bacterium]|nr:DUF1579 domain-containing protein [Bryobacteraceae bacterium]